MENIANGRAGTKKIITAQTIRKELLKCANPTKARLLSGFFKTGKGEYGEEDRFLGIMVPTQRKIAEHYKDIPLKEVEKLIQDPHHEVRLTGLLILTYKVCGADEMVRKAIYDFYLSHIKYINNWDLVDVTVRDIVGAYLFDFKKSRAVLYKLAHSKNIWERRIAIIATSYFIARHDFKDTIKISEILLHDTHDLIHKAVGWMLREMGKRDKKVLVTFLQKHAYHMPRTMLRYSIEKFGAGERRRYLSLAKNYVTEI